MTRQPVGVITVALLAGLFSAGRLSAASEPQRMNGASAREGKSTLRIGMWTLWHDKQVSLAPGANATWSDCGRCKTRTDPWPISVRAQGNTLVATLGIESVSLHAINISGSVTLTAHNESETLHHPLAITARNGELVLTVTLPVETYVERVVASESGPADTPQSLQALAIVVRTYALHVPHGHDDYDLCDSTHCQLLHWHGVPGRAPSAHAATLATAGETLWFHHQPALAYFNKDCGGHTASTAEIWPAAPGLARATSYLPSHPDPYCARTGSSDWASDLARADIASALAARGLAPPTWKHLNVARRATSGRALIVRIDNREISAEDFRLAIGAALGWSRVPSTWFEISEQGDRFYFHGRGWGHGVGLCQKGAAIMAAQGRSDSEILNQYFPGAEPLDDATGRAWTALTGPGFTLESLDHDDARFLPDLARARAEASQRSGLDPAATFIIRVFPSTSAFRDATLAPGWVAAFTEGNWIATQPLAILSARHLLAGTMLHEFLHGVIESHAGRQSPLWLREGLVELWSEPGDSASAAARRMPSQPLASVDSALAHAATEAQSATAHRDAAIYAAHLLERNGRDQVLAWLRSGLPPGVVAALR